MHDRFLLQTHGFRNVSSNGEVVGFEVLAKIGYYRGVALTIIKDLEVTVDGRSFSGEQITLELSGQTFTLSEMAREESVRWEFGENARIKVGLPGGLASGAHSVTLREVVQPSYMPEDVGFESSTTRTITLAPPCSDDGPFSLGVSLYSYQEEYLRGAMTLEDCLAEVAAVGARTVQLLPEQMIPGYPAPAPELIDRWNESVDRHGLTPSAMSTFVDVSLGGHRTMTIDEGVDRLIEQMELAKRLGFNVIRPTTGPVEDAAPELMRAAIPHAERLDVRLAPEIHAPVRLGGPLTTSYLQLIEETGTQHLGFTLDLGAFCRRLPAPLVQYSLRQGAQARVVRFLSRAFRADLPHAEVLDAVREMNPTTADMHLAYYYAAFGPATNPVTGIRDIAPFVFNVHAKFYEISPEGDEESIPYAEIFEELVKSGYRGSLDSEFEGQRLTQDAFSTDSCEAVRQHHVLMHDTLERALTESTAM